MIEDIRFHAWYQAWPSDAAIPRKTKWLGALHFYFVGCRPEPELHRCTPVTVMTPAIAMRRLVSHIMSSSIAGHFVDLRLVHLDCSRISVRSSRLSSRIFPLTFWI